MKYFKFLSLLLVASSLAGCWTSILTVAPVAEPVAPPKTVYTTTVTTPAPKHTTVTTVTVTSYNSDPCLYLDLNAVAAAFAESRSVREFEQLLNSSRYMINNLDLNRDGWVDYLRVIETHSGSYHTMLIQACLAAGIFQDVATLIAEHRPDVLYVEVIGDPYLYGYNYIVRPVFIKRPPMWDVYGHPGYAVWTSPYHYGYFPSYYTRPEPIYLNHYQAYVTTYMSNHHYCHRCDYPTTVFYSGYTTMTQPNSRRDYQNQHPNDSFEHRVTRTATSTNGVSVRNAGQLRSEINKAAANTKEQPKDQTASSATKPATTTSSRTTGSTTPSSRTTGSTTASSGSTAASGNTTGSSRSTESTDTSRSGSTSATSGSSRTTTATSTAASARTTPSTTVNTRVNKSGTTRTTVKTTDASGRTSTVKRESTSTRSSGTSARSGGSATRSSDSSVKSSQDKQSESSPRSSQRGR